MEKPQMDNYNQSTSPSHPPAYHEYHDSPQVPLPAFPPVVQQQPGPTTVTNTTYVVTTQPVPLSHRPWSSGICSGCMDITSCVCVAFCGPCYLCHISKSYGEGCCMPCCIPPTSALAMLRVKLRTEEKIYGSISSDYCTSCCCWGCALCQLKRELDVVRTRDDAARQLRGINN